MELLSLPVELFELVLYHAITARDVKRGLRLRLVNKLFAREVMQALYTFHLLDAVPTRIMRRTLVSITLYPSYLEHRVMHEPANGNPFLNGIRNMAIEIHQWKDARDPSHPTVESCVKSLVATWRSSSFPDLKPPWREIFCRSDRWSREEYQVHLFGAALTTNTLSYVQHYGVPRERMMIVNSRESAASLFGAYAELAAHHGDETLLAHLLITNKSEVDVALRIRLLELAAKAGRLEIVRFLYNFRKNDTPWGFGVRSSPNANFLNTLLKDIFYLDVYKFIESLRATYMNSPVPVLQLDEKLCHCARRDLLDMCSHLLRLGARAEGNDNPFGGAQRNGPVRRASYRGHVELVELLLDHGADPRTTMAPAASRCHKELIQRLLDRGISPIGALSPELGRSMYVVPVLAKIEAVPYLDVVKLLLDAGADPNGSIGKEIPLARAIAAEHVALFNLLLDRGADLHSPGTAEECVRRAKQDGLESMLRLLEEHGVDVNAYNDESSEESAWSRRVISWFG